MSDAGQGCIDWRELPLILPLALPVEATRWLNGQYEYIGSPVSGPSILLWRSWGPPFAAGGMHQVFRKGELS